jgi:hypothetical protein
VTRAWPLAFLALAAAACASPEATRARAQGGGADVGNVREPVAMHEGADPYWRTPRVKGLTGPDLGPARHADRLSR